MPRSLWSLLCAASKLGRKHGLRVALEAPSFQIWASSEVLQTELTVFHCRFYSGANFIHMPYVRHLVSLIGSALVQSALVEATLGVSRSGGQQPTDAMP